MAAVVPRLAVVGVGPGYGCGAAGESAALVSSVQGFADPVRDDAVGAADLEREPGVFVEDATPDVAVARDALRDRGRDVAEPVQPRRFGQPRHTSINQRPPRIGRR